MREQLGCVELYPGTDKRVESLWVRIKGQANMSDTAVSFSQNLRIVGVARAL